MIVAPAARPRRRLRRAGLPTTVVAVLAAVGVVHFYEPQRPLLDPPFVANATAALALPFATPAAEAYGRSGKVRMQFVRPGDAVELPLAMTESTSAGALAYQWVRTTDSVAVGTPRPLATGALTAPAEPGYYRLALTRDGQRRVVDGQTLAVLVPFEEKQGAKLRGFTLGTWVGEKLSGKGKAGLPEGFLPIDAHALALAVTENLTLGDILSTPDTEREGYPEFAAVDVRLLEKLELVLAEVTRMTGGATPPRLSVNSGFRPPSYNKGVAGAANNSRHQYGDAADVRIDADGDGRFSAAEVKLVEKAVLAVEQAHPDLKGGLGLYTSKRFRSPYVHIDARGQRARWNG
jgi:uncharacterized protein YcbK (DUF882 family)